MINFDKRKILTTTIEKLKIYGPLKFLSFILSEIKYRIYSCLFLGSYSQNGEDLVIDKLLGVKEKGFYVDIGAYDPTRFSNTKRFYLRGWSGINVEPNKNRFENFAKHRTRDINLNVGIGMVSGYIKFYEMFPNTLSTFSAESVKNYQKQGFRLISETKVKVLSLRHILKKYAEDKEIDFLSVDTEGFDLEVLKSNDWKSYRPKVICIESSVPGSSNLEEGGKFLLKIDYRKVLDNGINSIFTL